MPINRRKEAKSGTCFANPPKEDNWELCCRVDKNPAMKKSPAVLKPRLIMVRRLPWRP
jgi:hypothetical protein